MIGPLFNQILSPRWNSPLIRMFGLRIQGAAAPTLAPEIAPSFDVNQMDDPSTFFLRGEKLCSLAYFISAAVGFVGVVQVRNPANSGVLLVIDRAILHNTAGDVLWGIRQTTTDLTTLASNSNVRDPRYYNPVAGTLRCSAINSVDNTFSPIFSLFVVGRNKNANSDERTVGIVLPPGWAFVAYTDGTNGALSGTIYWRERPFLPEELATG